jgi:pimeloyl-ACP methyl ester carboxylesterase
MSSPETTLAGTVCALPRSVSLYNAAVAKCVDTAQCFGRFRPPSALTVNGPSGPLQVHVAYHGFAWSPQEFRRFMAVGNYEADELTRRYRRHGVGAPLVGIRRRPAVDTPPERFYPENLPFAASAVLRPNAEAVLGTAPCGDKTAATLEFYEPLHTDTLLVSGRPATLAADISAPWVVTLLDPNRMSVEVSGFFSPESTADYSGLYMLEPYQPGKIPIVLVHGVLSGPWTWTDMINELRADRALRERFQLWVFRYPTGGPMLHAATRLRSDLQAVRCVHDPAHRDASLDHMVLMGHSLGGLISKLQVSDSGCTLWASYANRSLDELRMSPADRELLRGWYFFGPQPHVRRVVFFATPHRGTTTRNRFVGRLAAAFVQTPEASGVTERVARANPGAFKTSAAGLLATSDDVLAADDRLSTAIRQLYVDPRVRLHSIIGSGQGGWGSEDSDGAVTVSSARLIGAASESLVPAEHASVHRHPAAIQEVKRILQEHLAELDTGLATQ